jgi:hypothetical protein
MEEMNGTELKAFHLVLITLACQTWTLSCLFDRVPFPTSTLQATLTSFDKRLKKMSAFLLIDKTLLEPKSEAWASLYRQKVYAPSQYRLAGARLGEIFRLFTPVYALCFGLNDYNRTGGTGRKNDPCYWIAGGHTAMEISPADEAISEVFLSVAAECENQILNILSEFHFFTERMSDFYPTLWVMILIPLSCTLHWPYGVSSLPLKTQFSGMVEATPSTQISECLVRILQGDSRFFGGEVHFGTDPNKIVTAEYWTWGEGDGSWQLRVPNIATLRLREIGKPSLELFAGSEHISRKLDEICRVIVNLAMARRENNRFVDIFGEAGTLQNASTAGALVFGDEFRVSIGFARIKERTVFLFENCLVFARQKARKPIIVHRVFLSDLLQVRYRFEHPGKDSGVLTIYWREHQPPNERRVSGARLFVDNLSVLKLWAAFLAINASTEPSKGIFAPMAYRPWNMPTLLGPTGPTTVRGMVASMPATQLVYWWAMERHAWHFVYTLAWCDQTLGQDMKFSSMNIRNLWGELRNAE